MATQRQIQGLTENLCLFVGRVVDKNITDDGKFAFLTLKVANDELQQNGQWVEMAMDIPLGTDQANKIGVIQKYVEKGRQLKVFAYYKNWAEGHIFMITKMQLGTKAFVPQGEAQG